MHTSIKKNYEIKNIQKKKKIVKLFHHYIEKEIAMLKILFFLRCWIHAYSFISQCTVIYLFLGWVGEMIKKWFNVILK